MARRSSVVRLAICVRATVWALGVLARYIVTPYDTSGTLIFDDPARASSATGDWLVGHAFGMFAHWDGVFFLEIARNGYQFEHFHAFYPLLPLLIRAGSWLLAPLELWCGVLSADSCMLVSGFLISNACCVLATRALYDLGLAVLPDSRRNDAYTAALLFACGPASVFMSAVYTESLFAWLSFRGLHYLVTALAPTRRRIDIDGQPPDDRTDGYQLCSLRKHLHCALCFALASATRSNGMLLALYLVCGRELYTHAGAWVIARAVEKGMPRSQWALSWVAGLQKAATPRTGSAVHHFSFWGRVRWALGTAAMASISTAPGWLYLLYGAHTYCGDHSTGEVHAAAQGLSRPWCSQQLVSSAMGMYPFIQQEYWGVGFGEYFQLKQIPNFVLASPMIVLSVYGIADAARQIKGAPQIPQRLSSTAHSAGPVVCTAVSPVLFELVLLPMTLHWAALLAVGVSAMNVQVTTRFLSACPPLYWYAATLISGPTSTTTIRGRLLLAYFVTYGVIGTVMFCNFYPWT
jgi:phosphatidylinositol glycan class V